MLASMFTLYFESLYTSFTKSKKKDLPKVILVSSGMSWFAGPSALIYSATKAFVVLLGVYLHKRQKNLGVDWAELESELDEQDPDMPGRPAIRKKKKPE